MNSRTENLSVLIAGLGSIGQRHLKNLVRLGVTDISLYRTGHSTLKNEDLNHYPAFSNFDEALDRNPSAVIVSNPTSLHMDLAIRAVSKGCHVFLEKPVSDSTARVDELRRLAEEKKVTLYTGYQFRFHPALRALKEWIQEGLLGKIVSVHVHWGEYLPGWHPWEDYRNSYSARKDLGGGVLMTLCHPFDYLRWLAGEIRSVSAVIPPASILETGADEAALVSLQFESGCVGSVYLDYVQRPAKHDLEVVGSLGTAYWNSWDGCASLQMAEKKEFRQHCPGNGFERNTMFLDEMAHFLECIHDHTEPLCGLRDGIRSLDVVLAAYQAASERRWIDVAYTF